MGRLRGGVYVALTTAFTIDRGGSLHRVSSPVLTQVLASIGEFQELRRAQVAGSAKKRPKMGVNIGGVPCAVRPVDLGLLAFAATMNTYHMRATRAVSRDVAGRKWYVSSESEASKARVTAALKVAWRGKTLSEGFRCVWTDRVALGNGYLELIPSRDGKGIVQFEHVPATEMWIRLDELGYVQQHGNDTVHFRAWGRDDEIEALPEMDPLRNARTYVQHFAEYSSWSPFYGVPDIIAAWSAIAIFALIAEFNLGFFSNNAIPDYVVLVEGEVDDALQTTIREYFRDHVRGQAHKTLVMGHGEGRKIEFRRLTSQHAREGDFRMLRTACRDEIIHAHGVPPQKVGIFETGKLGGNLATEQRKEYLESIVTPGQEQLVDRLESIIQAERGFGAPDCTIEFQRYDAEDEHLNAQTDKIYLDAGVLDKDEVREWRFPDMGPRAGGAHAVV